MCGSSKQIITNPARLQLYRSIRRDYISLTNIARQKNPNEPKDIVKNWMRSKTTIEFLGLWEKLHNPKFKGGEFDSFAREAGSNSFVLSPTKGLKLPLLLALFPSLVIAEALMHIKILLLSLRPGSVQNLSYISLWSSSVSRTKKIA